MKRWLTIATVVLLVGGGIGAMVWAAANQKPVAAEDIASPTSIHWHPNLAITIKGEKRAIPANIGTTGAHTNNIHTHDDSGTLHMELLGRVTKEKTKLKNFFTEWGKTFSPTCILDSCNGPDGTVTMTVNGQPNTEFGDFEMHDGDKIEIRFE